MTDAEKVIQVIEAHEIAAAQFLLGYLHEYVSGSGFVQHRIPPASGKEGPRTRMVYHYADGSKIEVRTPPGQNMFTSARILS